MLATILKRKRIVHSARYDVILFIESEQLTGVGSIYSDYDAVKNMCEEHTKSDISVDSDGRTPISNTCDMNTNIKRLIYCFENDRILIKRAGQLFFLKILPKIYKTSCVPIWTYSVAI